MLPVGKLDSDVLKRIVIDKIKYKSEDVKVRAGVGEDCAVVGYGDYDCVISTDPITSSITMLVGFQFISHVTILQAMACSQLP